jgi:UDP-glucose 4-epimerase
MADLKNYYEGKNVLITGGLGFIGSNLAHRLVGLKANVILVDSLIPEYGGNMFNIKGIEDKVKVNIADVRDENSMNYLVKGQDCIFNLAGQVSHLDSMVNPYTDLEINYRSQLSILEACRKNNDSVKLLFSATRSQYGRNCKNPVDESHPIKPTDINGINKTAGEWAHILYHDVYGIGATSLRLSNTFGPRHLMKHAKQEVLSWFIRLALDGQDITIYDEGRQLRDWNYIDDVVDSMLAAMASKKTDGEIYNIGSGKGVALVDAAQLCVKTAGKGRVTHIPFPPEKKKIEIGDYIADISKIKRDTGWQPRVSLEEGIQKTMDFFKKHKEHY